MEKISDDKTRQEICDLAVLASKAMKLEFCGVDMIRDRQGRLHLLETNSDPGFQNVEEITGESFAVPIIDHYERNAR